MLFKPAWLNGPAQLNSLEVIKKVWLDLASRRKEGGNCTDCPLRNSCVAKLALVSTFLPMPYSFRNKNLVGSQAWCLLTVIPVLRTWKLADLEFKAILNDSRVWTFETLLKATTTTEEQIHGQASAN